MTFKASSYSVGGAYEEIIKDYCRSGGLVWYFFSPPHPFPL